MASDLGGRLLGKVAIVAGGATGIGAATVAWLLSEDAAHVNGQVIQVDGGHFLRGGTGRTCEAGAASSLPARNS